METGRKIEGFLLKRLVFSYEDTAEDFAVFIEKQACTPKAVLELVKKYGYEEADAAYVQDLFDPNEYHTTQLYNGENSFRLGEALMLDGKIYEPYTQLEVEVVIL